MDDNKPKTPMDTRCPRKLEDQPDSWCPLAVLRLKAIRNAGRELTEEEESKLPGCPWAVNHQMSNYCFFKFIHEYSGDRSLSDMEIASLNSMSVDSVKKTEKVALVKLRANEHMEEVKSMHGDESVVNDSNSADDDYTIYR